MKTIKIVKILVLIVIALQSCKTIGEKEVKQLIQSEVKRQELAKVQNLDYIVDYDTNDTIALKLPFDPSKVVADSLFWHNKTDSIQWLHAKLFYNVNTYYQNDFIEYNNFLKWRYKKLYGKSKIEKMAKDSLVINVDSNNIGNIELRQAKDSTRD